MTTAGPGPAGLRGGVWGNSGFRRIWISQVVSEVGDWAARLAMSILVFSATGSALQSALVFSVSLLPALGPGQWLTVRTGRLPRRTLFLITESSRAVLLVVLALFPTTALAMVVAFATGLVRVPFMSQRSAMIPEIVGLAQVVSATKVHQFTQNLTILVGYAVGGVLVGLFTVSGALLFGAVTFAMSGLLLASITHPANRTRATRDTAPSLRAGWVALRTLPAVTAAVPSRWREPALLTWSAALIAGPAVAGVVGVSTGGTWAPAVALVACGAMFGAAGPANAVASLQLPVEQRAAVFALVIGVLFAAQAVAGPVAGYLFDGYGTNGLATLLVVPIIAAAVTHLTLTRTLPHPDPAN